MYNKIKTNELAIDCELKWGTKRKKKVVLGRFCVLKFELFCEVNENKNKIKKKKKFNGKNQIDNVNGYTHTQRVREASG